MIGVIAMIRIIGLLRARNTEWQVVQTKGLDPAFAGRYTQNIILVQNLHLILVNFCVTPALDYNYKSITLIVSDTNISKFFNPFLPLIVPNFVIWSYAGELM